MDSREQHVIRPVGEYATIDVAGQNATVAAPHAAGPGVRARATDSVLAAPHRFAPPVLYALAGALFAAGRRDDGAFWFYAGQVRARFDAERCTDPTAASAVDVLNQHYGGPINQHAFADPDALRATVTRAVEWDRAAPHDYDHRWINLHGMAAFGAPTGPLSRPVTEWAAIAERTRAEYLQGLADALDGLRP